LISKDQFGSHSLLNGDSIVGFTGSCV